MSENFEGTIYFKKGITMEQMRYMDKILGTDIRNNSELENLIDKSMEYTPFYHIDLQFNEDFSGLEWSGGEGTRGLAETLNLITDYMKYLGHPIQYDSVSKIYATYHDYGERAVIKIVNNRAVEISLPDIEDEITCPNCDHKFKLED